MLGCVRLIGTNPVPELDLAITIITANEEHDLPRCLASLPTGAEVIVVDSHSHDRTVAIARNYGAKVSVSPFSDYGQQKNKALRLATRNWVFSIDADEEMDAVLRLWLQENFTRTVATPAKSKPLSGSLEGFKIKRQPVFMGKKLRFGKSLQFCLRLFRRATTHFVGAIHEEAVVANPQAVTKLKHGRLYHYSYVDHHDYYTKFNHYTDVFAQQCYQQHRKVPPLHVLRPLTSFLHLYVFRGGFLDGYPGYCLAIYASLYSFVKYAKLSDRYRRAALPPSATPAQR